MYRTEVWVWWFVCEGGGGGRFDGILEGKRLVRISFLIFKYVTEGILYLHGFLLILIRCFGPEVDFS